MSARCPHLTAILSIAVLAFEVPKAAASYCSKPDAPYCAERYGAFDDQDDFDRCKREMESYKDDVQTYLDCRSDEARRANEAGQDNETARNEYSDAVDSFNRRARQ